MFGRRSSTGMEISSAGISVARVVSDGMLPSLTGSARVTFPREVLHVSLKDHNVTDRQTFVSTVRECVNLLDHRTKRVSVSLPDGAGRAFLIDLETPFGSREEAIDLIRWKLKKVFPVPVQDIHLDFQPIERKVTGELSVMVSCVANQVILEYEDLLMEAGLEPFQIDFTAFNLFHLFARAFRMSERKAFVCWYGSVLSIFVLMGGKLAFHRTKEIPLERFDGNRIFREISSSFIAFRGKSGGVTIQEVYCFSSSEDREALELIVADATEMEPVMLDTGRIVRSAGQKPDTLTLSLLSSAIAAACRVL